jgi:hypothetical protein
MSRTTRAFDRISTCSAVTGVPRRAPPYEPLENREPVSVARITETSAESQESSKQRLEVGALPPAGFALNLLSRFGRFASVAPSNASRLPGANDARQRAAFPTGLPR